MDGARVRAAHIAIVSGWACAHCMPCTDAHASTSTSSTTGGYRCTSNCVRIVFDRYMLAVDASRVRAVSVSIANLQIETFRFKLLNTIEISRHPDCEMQHTTHACDYDQKARVPHTIRHSQHSAETTTISTRAALRCVIIIYDPICEHARNSLRQRRRDDRACVVSAYIMCASESECCLRGHPLTLSSSSSTPVLTFPRMHACAYLLALHSGRSLSCVCVHRCVMRRIIMLLMNGPFSRI